MYIPHAVEWLCTLRRPGGGYLVAIDAIQILIPIFPPNTIMTFSAGPIASDYGQIVYYFRFGPQMVPDVFEGTLQIWGHRALTGIWTQMVLDTELHGFRWVTQAEPAFFHFRNISGLNQVFEGGYSSVRISSEQDFESVTDALMHMSTSAKSEQLAEECRDLLMVLTGGGG